MISIEYFFLSEETKNKEFFKDLIGVILKSVKVFGNFKDISIKIIGLEEDQSKPRLILLDLVSKEPYLKEVNFFTIRINSLNYEVLTSEDIYLANDIDDIKDIIRKIIVDYNKKNSLAYSVMNNRGIKEMFKVIRRDSSDTSKKSSPSYYVSRPVARKYMEISMQKKRNHIWGKELPKHFFKNEDGKRLIKGTAGKSVNNIDVDSKKKYER